MSAHLLSVSSSERTDLFASQVTVNYTDRSFDETEFEQLLNDTKANGVKRLILTKSKITLLQREALELFVSKNKGLSIVDSQGERFGNLYMNWEPYNMEKINSFGFHETTKAALQRFAIPPKRVIDFGCGTGQETLALLSFEDCERIYAIDADISATKILRERIPHELSHKVISINEPFIDTFIDEKVDLLISSFTLPYRAPEDFPTCWQKVVDSISANGVLSCHLFGISHQDAPNIGMTFFVDEKHVQYWLEKDFTDIWIDVEVGYTRKTHGQHDPDKPFYWHLFHIVATKK